jgi:hypothetical protein
MTSRAGVPDPLDARVHRPVGGDADTLKAGATYANGNTRTALLPIAGALSVRLRGLFTGAGGTIALAYLRPDGVTPYTTNNPASIPVTAGAEFVSTFQPNGEGWLRVQFTASGTGAVTYFDVMQV